jgi:hypothetical protein
MDVAQANCLALHQSLGLKRKAARKDDLPGGFALEAADAPWPSRALSSATSVALRLLASPLDG